MINYKNKENRFSQNILIFSIIFMYIVPMSIFDTKDFFILNKASYNFILVIFYLIYVMNGYIKFKIIDFIIISFMIIRFFITSDLESFGLSYLLILRYLDFKKINLRNNKILLYLLPASVIFYSVLHRYYFSSRIVSTSIGEINQVGFTIMMLFFIFESNKMKILSNLAILAGLLTFSRNFFLGIVIYFILKNIINASSKSKLKDKIPTTFQFYSIIGIATVVLMYFVFSRVTDINTFSTYNNFLERYFTYFDNSNYQRFIANIAVVRFYLFKPVYLLLGIPYGDYSQYLLQYQFGFGLVVGKINAPHNFYFKFLYKYGIFSFIVFSITAKAINKRLNLNNLPIFITFLIYAIFLGTGFYESYLIILLYLLDRANTNIKNKTSKIN